MDSRFENALRQALTPSEEASTWLNQKIVNQMEEHGTMIEKKKRKFPTASAAAILGSLVLCVSSVTVYATWKYMSSSDIATQIQDMTLAEAFSKEQALFLNETQCYADYKVTLLGTISGEELSAYPHIHNGSIAADRTYVAIAIENANGMPMPDTSQEDYGKLEFFASPLIGGYPPAFLNLAALSGNYTDMVEDGILYRLLECHNVEMFADHDLYLCVSQGMFYDAEAYCYDKLTGEISRNEAYEGLNALFVLPMDRSKADPEKAARFLAGLGFDSGILTEKLYVELETPFEVKFVEGNEKGTEIATYALQFVGNPYAWGENSLTEGTDSSGFTQSIYAQFGISLPHSSNRQRETGIEVKTLADAQPGDLIFYETPAHVAIYLGNNYIVHAMPEVGICISRVDFDEVTQIRRMTLQQ